MTLKRLMKTLGVRHPYCLCLHYRQAAMIACPKRIFRNIAHCQILSTSLNKSRDHLNPVAVGVEDGGQLSASCLCLGLHCEVLEADLHRRQLDPHPAMCLPGLSPTSLEGELPP